MFGFSSGWKFWAINSDLAVSFTAISHEMMLLETIFSVTSAYLSTIFNFYKSPSFLCNVFSSAKFSFLMPYSFNVFRMHNRVFIFYISEFTKCSIPFDCKHFPHFTLASSLQCTVFRFCPQPGLLDERMS